MNARQARETMLENQEALVYDEILHAVAQGRSHAEVLSIDWGLCNKLKDELEEMKYTVEIRNNDKFDLADKGAIRVEW